MRIISKLLPASKMKLVISSIGVMALIAFSSFVIFEATKAEVAVVDNGEELSVRTHANTVGDLLDEVGITVGEHDALSHATDAQVETGMEVTYITAKQVMVDVDGTETAYYTTVDTVGEFFAENNLSFTKHDDVSHTADDAIEDGLKLEVAQAFQVTVNDGGKKKKVWTTGGTVEDLLASANIKYNKKSNDKLNVKLDDTVQADDKISIIRVTKSKKEVTEAVAFQEERQEDSSLEKGKTRVVQEGKEGSVIKVFEIIKENGKEVDRKLIETKTVEEGQNRVIALGTKEPQQDLVQVAKKTPKQEKPKQETKAPAKKKPAAEKPSGKEFYVTASAFTATCSGCSGVTRIGINLKANPNAKVIAVDPSIIPLGTKVWVEGYGEAIAGDTGGNIVGHRIDVHVPTKADAYRWGVRKVKIRILN